MTRFLRSTVLGLSVSAAFAMAGSTTATHCQPGQSDNIVCAEFCNLGDIVCVETCVATACVPVEASDCLQGIATCVCIGTGAGNEVCAATDLFCVAVWFDDDGDRVPEPEEQFCT